MVDDGVDGTTVTGVVTGAGVPLCNCCETITVCFCPFLYITWTVSGLALPEYWTFIVFPAVHGQVLRVKQ